MDTIDTLTTAVPLPVLDALRDVVGVKGWIDDAGRLELYLVEERRLFRGRCAAVVRPASTEEVARVVGLCAEAGIAIVPHGGNTGLVGGGVPAGGIILSTARLDRIRAIDPVNRTMTIEAGVILADVQAAAHRAGALFPLSLGAEGSCHIGGNLATNAGGLNVLRYGNARDLVLGLEVVLPDGRIWNGLTGLRKNNTGYDLKHLFLGSEGTLGIITAAVVKLFAKPRTSETALVAIASVEAAVELFTRLNDVVGDALSAFELMSRLAVDLCLRHVPNTTDPFDLAHPWYVLLRVSSPRRNDPLRDALEEALAEAFACGSVLDAVVAQNGSQADELWRIRESIPDAQKPEGGSIKNDVSVPLSRVAEFIGKASAAVEAALPGIRVVAFGHLGDGNIHFNLTQPPGADRAAYLAQWDRIERIVSDIAAELDGSFSAEHGIGLLKRGSLRRYKQPVEIDLMRRLKKAIDPKDIMNPGKILAAG